MSPKIETSKGIAERALELLASDLETEGMVDEAGVIRGQLVVIRGIDRWKKNAMVYEISKPGDPEKFFDWHDRHEKSLFDAGK